MRGLSEVVGLYGEQDQVGHAQVGGVVRGRGLNDEGAEVGASDFQATLADGIQVPATGQLRDVMARAREKTAVQPADPSGADNRNPHRRQYRSVARLRTR